MNQSIKKRRIIFFSNYALIIWWEFNINKSFPINFYPSLIVFQSSIRKRKLSPIFPCLLCLTFYSQYIFSYKSLLLFNTRTTFLYKNSAIIVPFNIIRSQRCHNLWLQRLHSRISYQWSTLAISHTVRVVILSLFKLDIVCPFSEIKRDIYIWYFFYFHLKIHLRISKLFTA